MELEGLEELKVNVPVEYGEPRDPTLEESLQPQYSITSGLASFANTVRKAKAKLFGRSTYLRVVVKVRDNWDIIHGTYTEVCTITKVAFVNGGNPQDAVDDSVETITNAVPGGKSVVLFAKSFLKGAVVKTLIKKGFKINADGVWKSGSKAFRDNLELFTGIAPKAGDQAHHIFPKWSKLRKFFDSHGIDVNNPAFGKWMPRDKHVGKFSSEYNKLWEKYIESLDGKKVSLETLLKKADEFEKKALEAAKKHKEMKLNR